MSNLMRMALESEATEQPAVTGKEHTVVLDGPLSLIFAKALNTAFAKEDPVTGGVAQESEANDAYHAAALMRQAAKPSPDDVVEEEIPSIDPIRAGVRAVSTTAEVAVPVFQQLTADIGNSCDVADFIFVKSEMGPSDDSPIGASSVELVPVTKAIAVESIQVIVKYKDVKS